MTTNITRFQVGDKIHRPSVLNVPIAEIETALNAGTASLAAEASTRAAADSLLLSVYTVQTGEVSVTSTQYPVGDIRRYGGAVSATAAANVTALRNAAASLAALGGGTVTVPGGAFSINAAVSFPSTVNLWCAGKFATTFNCTTATAGFRFGDGGGITTVENYGGISGNFRMASTTATDPMFFVGLSVARTFAYIDLNGGNAGTGDGLRLEQTQNCLFMEFDAQRCGGSGVVLDYGAGGNLFTKCEFYRNGYANGRSRYSGANTGGGYSKVQHNTFLHCLFEGTAATTVACFDHAGGSRCVFDSSHLTLFSGTTGHADLYGTDIPVLRVWKENVAAEALSQRVFLMGATALYGSAPSVGTTYRGYGVQVENSPGSPEGLNVYISPGVLIDSCKSAFYVSDTSQVYVQNVVINNCTARFTSFGGTGTEGLVVKASNGHTELTGVDPAVVVQKITAATGQSVPLSEWRNAAAGLVGSMTAGGTFTAGASVNGTLMLTSTRGGNTAPAHSFVSDPDTGMYSPTTNEVAFATGGTKRIHIGSAGEVHFAGGTPVAKPTLNAASTDLATVIALTNQIRAALIANGLAS